MKFKLFLLGGIITLFGIFNYSSADLTVSWNGSSYVPNEVAINGSSLFSENFSCNSDVNCCSMSLYTTTNTKVCEILYCNEEGDYFVCDDDLDGDYIIKYDNEYDSNSPFTSISLPNTIVIGGNEGGTEGSVIFGGFGSLTPAISGLWESVSQIIPLVVYIGIGVLLAIIGFFAIRWLLNRLNGKINGYFNSKRG